MKRGYILSVVAVSWMCGAFVTSCGDEGGENKKPDGCASGSVMCGDACCEFECVEGACIDVKTDPQNCGKAGTVCDKDESCESGKCVKQGVSCTAPLELCGSACVDMQTDALHCGKCDHACLGSESCEGGECVIKCAEGLTLLKDGTCVDLMTDGAHCGREGNVCADQD